MHSCARFFNFGPPLRILPADLYQDPDFAEQIARAVHALQYVELAPLRLWVQREADRQRLPTRLTLDPQAITAALVEEEMSVPAEVAALHASP